jgi:hypothetical protein
VGAAAGVAEKEAAEVGVEVEEKAGEGGEKSTNLQWTSGQRMQQSQLVWHHWQCGQRR